MPGLATVQASSAAYYTVPNQSSTALNTGWVLDQRLDPASATGGFLTNSSPTSSGYIFTSSGDGTTGTGNSFWSLGRAAWILQGTTNFYGIVQTASVAAGITTVGLSSASVTPTAGLSTGLAFTSVAAATQTGQFHWVPNQDNAWDIGSSLRRWANGFFAASVRIGATTSTTGLLRVPNNPAGGIVSARDAANASDLNVLSVDGTNRVTIDASANGVIIGSGAAGGWASLGATPATTGQVRLTNNQWVTSRNAANSANLNVIQANGSDLVTFGTIVNHDSTASIALGGGGAPTFGSVGGSGPAVTGQNAWLKVFIGGTASYVPFWR